MCTTFRRKKNHDLNVFFESHQLFHLFGLSETRLKIHIPSEGLSLPHYSLIRKDAARSQHTGLVVYIHSSVSRIVRRRPDLESEAVESVWLEIQTRKSSILVVIFIETQLQRLTGMINLLQ